MSDLLVQPRSISLNTWSGDIQVFGDLRQAKPQDVMAYFHMNNRQKQSFSWLLENHLPMTKQLYNQEHNQNLRSLVTIGRTGFNKDTQLIVVQLAVMDVRDLRPRLVENRFISLGKRGGRTLLNPERVGNHVGGSYVLKTRPNISILHKI